MRTDLSGILRGVCGETITVGNRELIHGVFPLFGGSTPIDGDVAQCQPKQFGCGIVAGEVPSRLDDLAQAAVKTLDGIGRVDHAPNCWAECEERDDAVPGPAPGRHNRGELLPQGLASKASSSLAAASALGAV